MDAYEWVNSGELGGNPFRVRRFYFWTKINAPHLAGALYPLQHDPPLYVRVGGQAQHNAGWADVHHSNHWGTSNMIAKLTALFSTWNGFEAQPPGVDCAERPVLAINDMSLELGGRYDINQNWVGSHVEHQNGEEADIRSVRGNSENGVPLSMERDFCLIAEHVGFNRVILEKRTFDSIPPEPCEYRDVTSDPNSKFKPHFHISLRG